MMRLKSSQQFSKVISCALIAAVSAAFVPKITSTDHVIAAETDGARTIVDEGSNGYCRWTFYSDSELFVECLDSGFRFAYSGIDSSIISQVESLVIDVTEYQSGLPEKNYAYYWFNGEGCDVSELSIISLDVDVYGFEISNFANVDEDHFSLTEGARYEHLLFGNMGFNSLEGFENLEIDQVLLNRCNNLKKVVVPVSVKSFDMEKCDQVTELEFVDGADGMTYIEISDNPKLSKITFPDSVTDITQLYVSSCKSLKSLSIPDSVGNIANMVIRDIPIEALRLPSNTETIVKNAFEDDKDLQRIYIPVSVATIEETAFNGCDSITDVYFGGSESDWEKIKVGICKETYVDHGSAQYYADSSKTLEDIFGDAVIHFNARSGWVQDGKTWYYYDREFAKLTGWQKLGDWYYFDSNGAMKTGWIQDGSWYYLTSSGAMATGWQQVDGKWYYFENSGVMKTGWLSSGGSWYYLTSSGAMASGWQYIGNKYYYFRSGGDMAANEYCGGYWLNSDGSWTYQHKATWRRNSTGWWYGDETGWYAKTETLKIDGKDYNFNAEGYCTNP